MVRPSVNGGRLPSGNGWGEARADHDEANAERVDAVIGQAVLDHHAIAQAVLFGDLAATVGASERHLVNIEQRMVHGLV